jgi:hypothetical protein
VLTVVVCPVQHTALNWITIGVFSALTLTIAGAVLWSAIDHRRGVSR